MIFGLVKAAILEGARMRELPDSILFGAGIHGGFPEVSGSAQFYFNARMLPTAYAEACAQIKGMTADAQGSIH